MVLTRGGLRSIFVSMCHNQLIWDGSRKVWKMLYVDPSTDKGESMVNKMMVASR